MNARNCWAPSYVREWASYAWGPSKLHLKKKKSKSGKKKTQRREEREKIHLLRFRQQADLASSVVRSSRNLEEMFETRVATISTVEIKF